MKAFTPYLKALYGAVAAGLGATQVAYAAHGMVTWGDAISIGIATVGAFGVIWGVPNYGKSG